MKKELMERTKELNATYLHRTFKIKFLPCTNTKGDRIRIVDCNFDKSITLELNYEFNNITEQSIYFLFEKGFDVQGVISSGQDTIICCKWTIQILNK